MKKIYVTLVILFFPLGVMASGGDHDILIWKGDMHTLYSKNPLELREDYDSLHRRIISEIDSVLQATYPNDPDIYTGSTLCGRGYKVEWFLLNDTVFLNRIYPCYYPEVEINLANIFPNIGENQKIFASWINGDLFFPQGKQCIDNLPASYEPIFEFETGLRIETGLLINVELFHNKIAKRSAFFERAMSEKLTEFVHKNINWDNLPDLTNKSILICFSVNINEQGRVESINEEHIYYKKTYLNESTQSLDSSKHIFGADINDAFFQESLRIARLIPEWNVIYQRGKIVEGVLCIEFSERNRKEYEH